MAKSNLIIKPNFNIIHPHRELNIIASPGLHLSWEVKDPHTGRIEQKGDQVGRSFLKQFLQQLYMCMSGVTQTFKDIGGTNRAGSWNYGEYNFLYYNFLIGSSNQAVSWTDYNLITPIANGSGEGKMAYGSITHTAAAYDDTRVWNRETRSFTNNSGASITINEIGYQTYIPISGYYMLIMRDLTDGIVVPATKVITFNYDFESQKDTERGWTFLKAFFTRLYIHIATSGTGYTDIYKSFRVGAPPAGTYVSTYNKSSNIQDLGNIAGIELGTSTDAVGVEQTEVGSKIANGEGSGQLKYLGCGVDNFSIGASSGQFDIFRQFQNKSGDSISVNQVGLRCLYGNYSQAFIYCEKLSEPFVIPNNSYAEVRLTMKVAV